MSSGQLGERAEALLAAGQFAEAEREFGRILAEGQADANVHLGLAMALHRQGKLGPAVDQYKMSLALDPSQPRAHNALGAALQMAGDLAAAIHHYRKAIAIQPENHAAWGNLGAALHAKGELQEAMDCYAQALAVNPEHAESHYNLGRALQDSDALADAVASYRRALGLKPDYPAARNNLAIALRDQGNLDEALAAYSEGIAKAPDWPELRYNHAQALLEAGDLQRGWEEYEWRFAARDVAARQWSQPRWQGEDVRGKTVLVWAEQGFGDALQFARFASLLAEWGARVILEVQPALVTLCRSLPGVDQVVGTSDQLPTFDLHVPLISLAKVFASSLDTLPSKVPYLRAPEATSEAWRRKLGGEGMNIGVVWSGNPNQRNDRNRSLPPSVLFAMLNRYASKARFHSLQVGPSAGAVTKASFDLVDLSPELTDFAETAGALEALDLCITVDTSVAHLAGALGRPVWTMLTFAPDWRWLRHRADSPWYPSMRLFRQSRPGQWGEVIAQVEKELERLLSGDPAALGG